MGIGPSQFLLSCFRGQDIHSFNTENILYNLFSNKHNNNNNNTDNINNNNLYAVADRFYIALFSALEQTHCDPVPCDSK